VHLLPFEFRPLGCSQHGSGVWSARGPKRARPAKSCFNHWLTRKKMVDFFWFERKLAFNMAN
jgi:hypothetical protein